MKKRIRTICITFVLLTVVFYAGFAIGSVRKFKWMLSVQLLEVSGNLSFNVEALALLRTGNETEAISNLELRVDSAIPSLVQNQPWTELSSDVQQLLKCGKVYRTAFPPSNPSEELARILGMIPLPPDEVSFCSPAMQKVFELSQSLPGETQEK